MVGTTSAGGLNGVRMQRYNVGRVRWWEATSVRGSSSLNSLDPSLTLPHRWWGPFNLVYKYPYWLPFTKMLGPWWGQTKPFCGYVNEDQVGTVLPGGGTHKHYM